MKVGEDETGNGRSIKRCTRPPLVGWTIYNTTINGIIPLGWVKIEVGHLDMSRQHREATGRERYECPKEVCEGGEEKESIRPSISLMVE